MSMNIPMFGMLWIIAVPIFFLIDMLWLGVVAKDFYAAKIGYLLGPVNWTAALIFYALFLCGLVFFAMYPAVQAGSVARAFAYGAFFGLVTYATYDLTNQATIKDWPLIVTVVDMIWGTVLGSVVSGVTVYAYRLLG